MARRYLLPLPNHPPVRYSFRMRTTLSVLALAAIVAGCAPATVPTGDPFPTDGSGSAVDPLPPSSRPPKPEGTTSDDFLLNEMGYECSQPITGEWREHSVGQMGSPGWYFYPSDTEDLEKYCRTTYIIEYHSILQILKKPDVAATIAKYDTAHAWVRALSHEYIDDKDFLKRILLEWNADEIDCIIVVHSPEGTRFFVENGAVHESHADHRYVEVPASEFLASLNAASDEDVTSFWLGLR